MQETLEPGASVSAVARRHGFNANQVFGWRKQYQEGSLAAVNAGETVVPASELAAAIKEIKKLQRLLGKKTLEVEILKEAVEWAFKKMYGPPWLCKRAPKNEAVCVNVSGLSRVSRFWRQGHDGICALGSQ